MRKYLLGILTFCVAGGLWLSLLSTYLHRPRERRDALAQAHLAAVETGDVPTMRRINPEWELMRRMYVVLALANRVLDRGGDRELAAIDHLCDQTLADLDRHGPRGFLLDYVDRAAFVDTEATSVFVEGEVLMMLAAREVVAKDRRYEARLREQAKRVVKQIEAGPVLCAESYPNECWAFCNSVAIAGLLVADASLGTDHRALAARWTTTMRERLTDPDTGLLVSSYTYDGFFLDGPEGSSIWAVAHNLQLIDPDLARDQYDRAWAALGAEGLGFAYAMEWPAGQASRPDVDSGPVIPIFDAAPASSGLAILATAAFGDRPHFDALMATLELTAAPIERDGALGYAAAGPMGDAVVFYAHEVGPLWAEVERRQHHVATTTTR